MKNKCTKCQEMRKASGLSYLKCPKCKQEARDERKKNKKKKTKKIVYKSEMAKTNDELRKISKRLNQDSINKFIKERNGIKRWQIQKEMITYNKIKEKKWTNYKILMALMPKSTEQ